MPFSLSFQLFFHALKVKNGRKVATVICKIKLRYFNRVQQQQLGCCCFFRPITHITIPKQHGYFFLVMHAQSVLDVNRVMSRDFGVDIGSVSSAH